MTRIAPCAEAVVLVSFALASSARADAIDFSAPSLVQATLSIMNAIPPPDDDPLLDSSGNVMYDALGKPMSDPNESFHQVKPQEFDPAHTGLVQALWLHGTGCPTDAFVAVPNASFTGVAGTAPYSDSGCPTGDGRDQRIEGLLLAKTGPTSNFASATAELKKVRGLTLTELGYDIRKSGGTASSPLGSHCGGGAPRFNVVTQDNVLHFIGCNSGTVTASSGGWLRLRWSPLEAFPPITSPVSRIFIVFDEGQDAAGAPDQFGAAFLDNSDVNGMLVGHGASDAD
jgi:hypothetical protein